MSGEWVIIKDDIVVEKDKDISVILKLSENYNEEEIVISKEPSAAFCFY